MKRFAFCGISSILNFINTLNLPVFSIFFKEALKPLLETHGTFKNFQEYSPFENGRFNNTELLIFCLWTCGPLRQK